MIVTATATTITLSVLVAALLITNIILFYLLVSSKKKLESTFRELEKNKNEFFDNKAAHQHEIEKMMLRVEVEENRLKAMLAEKASEEKKILYENIDADRAAKVSELEAELVEQRAKRIAELEEAVREKSMNIENQLILIDENFQKKKVDYEAQIQAIQFEVESWKNKHGGAIDSFKALDELNNKTNYRRMQLTADEAAEIEELREVIKKLRNPMPFYRAVYDIYFSNKVSDLVNNVVGKKRVSGIYKITEIKSGKTYVGQSVDIGERWKQHIRRGSGAVPVTQNKLYPAMLESGVENFTFEVLETTEDVSKLNQMEKYWQEFFKSKEFGFSMK